MLQSVDWKGGHEELYWDYWFWLVDQVGLREGYDDLLRYLFRVEFKVVIFMDKNRVMDGLALRNRWMDRAPVAGDFFEGRPCTVLEMLVALAVRIEDDVMGDRDVHLFWRMLENLGLTDSYDWDDILENWMDRRIGRDGSGGLFPLRRNEYNKDQRKIEIWGQCVAWVNEWYEDNYGGLG